MLLCELVEGEVELAQLADLVGREGTWRNQSARCFFWRGEAARMACGRRWGNAPRWASGMGSPSGLVEAGMAPGVGGSRQAGAGEGPAQGGVGQ